MLGLQTCVCTTSVRCPWKPEEGVRAPGSGVSGGCGCCVGDGNRSWALHKSSRVDMEIKLRSTEGYFCWDSFQCRLLGYRYRCYLRYTACVHTWLPLPNSFLICQVEITTASLLGVLGQLREMVPIQPLTYGCRHLKAFCGMSYYTLLVSLKILQLLLSGWLSSL